MRYTEASQYFDFNEDELADRFSEKKLEVARRMWDDKDHLETRNPRVVNTHRSIGETRQIFEAKTSLRLQQAFPEYSDILELFVVKKGLESVDNMIRRNRSRYKNFANISLVKNVNVLQDTTGLVFERLAYSWLNQQEHEGMYLDPGSCSRIFTRLMDSGIAKTIPDGVHVTFQNGTPTIDSIFEYKTNPEAHPKYTGKSLNALLQLSENRGKSYRFRTPVVIDEVRGIEARSLSFAHDVRTSLVIPANRDCIAPPQVEVIRTQFDSGFVNKVVYSALHDISNSEIIR